MPHTEAQLEAIGEIDRNLQIIACAGSGKTRTVAQRIVHILEERQADGITPESIVAFTFTDKAAAELKDRITRLYAERFGNVEGLAGMYVGTIHGFCLDLLQQYVPDYLKYDVLDEIGQRLLIDRNYRKSGMADLGLRRWIESNLYVRILSTIREAEVDPDALKGQPVAIASEAYQNLLDDHRYLDYDNILVRAVAEVFGNEHLRQQLAERVKHLTVDEYQDINPIQEQLIWALHALGANVCVVGDDDQNIYQWRGSDVENILTFTGRYPGVHAVPLATNFRCSSAIVEAARRLIEVNERRLPKDMESGGIHTYARGDLLALSFSDPAAEAAWIAGRIQALHGLAFQEEDGRKRGLAWSDCAILLRSVRHNGQPVVDALKAAGIPYVVTGMANLFDTAEAQAAVGIFQYLVDEITSDALKGVWQAADLGLRDADLKAGLQLLTERRLVDPKVRFSVYNLQRVYLDYLEAIRLREERVPGGRGEVVYYNLGKFSQAISDYEAIHFKSKPDEKYSSFVQFLRHQAPQYYPEGGQDEGYAVPDAVRIMTVHQAKGMEFPAVFIPALLRNRFPSKKQRNRVWEHIPREAVRNADRYDSSEEDERRLMYVALTRAEKYLHCTWAPTRSNHYARPSVFFEELTRDPAFLTRDPGLPASVERLVPEPRRPLVNVELSFSDLKYFLECPYQFKLRLLYGFNPPIHEALGYGRSLHNALAEIHKRGLAGERFGEKDAPGFVDRHLQVRYAYPELERKLRTAAEAALTTYLKEQGPHLDKLVHAEEVVELALPDGVLIHGRIDLIKRTDTGEIIVVDFKSTERAQAEELTRVQLHVYALGYEQRFGKRADLIEIHNLDAGGSIRELIDEPLMAETLELVREAGEQLRENRLDRCPAWGAECATCDLPGICRTSPAVPV